VSNLEMVKVLQQTPIFHGLNETECRQLADVAEVLGFAPGEVIIRQNENCRNLWIVLEGECEVVRYRQEDHKPEESIVLAKLEPYSHFGEMSFFHPAPHSANVRAASAVKLLCIARSDYDDLLDQGVSAGYKLAYNVVQSMADRLRRMDEWVAELASHGHPLHQVPEWSSFRDKLFSGWNL
jgi:CRP-like cAMP-binding protein